MSLGDHPGGALGSADLIHGSARDLVLTRGPFPHTDRCASNLFI